MAASTGCRAIDGRWQLWNGAPTITESGHEGECPERMREQEATVGNALSEPIIELRRDELVLRYAHANDQSEVVYRR